MTTRRPWRKALRSTLVVTATALLTQYVVHLGASGFFATFGVFAMLVLADFGGPRRSRFLAYLGTGVVGMALIVLGTLVSANRVAMLVATLIVVFVLALARVLRGYVASAFNVLLPTYVVALTSGVSAQALPASLAAFAGATLVAALAAITLWPVYPTPTVHKALGDALRASAALIGGMRPLDPHASSEDVQRRTRALIAAIDGLVRENVGNLGRPGQDTARDRGLSQLVDDVERLRYALRWPVDQTARASLADMAMLRTVRGALDTCGRAMNGEVPPPELDPIVRAHAEYIAEVPRRTDTLLAGRSDETVQSVNAGFYFSTTALVTAMIVRHARAALGYPADGAREDRADNPGLSTISMFESAVAPAKMLASSLQMTSPWFRRAAQIAIAVTIAVATIQVAHLHTGSWVVLGILAALQLDAGRSRRSAWAVVVGTVAGFGICAALVVLIGSHTPLLVTLFPVVCFLAVWTPSGKYELPLRQAFFTILFVMLVSLSKGALSMTTDDVRIEDIGVGLLICLIVSTAMWRHGVADKVHEVLRDAVNATSGYFAAACTYLTSPMTADAEETLRSSARTATAARIRAEEAYDLAISQGSETGGEARAWTSVVNAVDHAFFAATMLRSMESFGLAPIPDPRVAELVRRDADEVARLFAEGIGNLHEQQSGRSGGSGGAASGAATAITELSPRVSDSGVVAELVATTRRIVEGYSGHQEELTFTIAPCVFAMSPGQATVSMLWVQDWILYFYWMAQQTEVDANAGHEGIDVAEG